MSKKDDKAGFFVSGYYGNNNFGDDLMLETVLEQIIKVKPDAVFYIRNNRQLDFLKGKAYKFQETKLDQILFQSTASFSKVIQFIRRYVHYIRACKYLVFGGGTVIHDNNGIGSLSIMFIMVVLARMFRVKVYFVGIGIKKLNKWVSGFLLNLIFVFSEQFNVRDRTSYTYLEELRGFNNSKANLTADIAYSNCRLHESRRDVLPAETLKCVGIALNGSLLKPKGTSQDMLLERIAEEIKKALNEGYHVRMLILSPTDSEVTEMICRLLNDDRIRMELLNMGENVSIQLKDLCAVISMRFHALVAATIFEIPICGINIDHKIADLCAYFEAPIREDWFEFSLKDAVEESIESAKKVSYREKAAQLKGLSDQGFSFLKNI